MKTHLRQLLESIDVLVYVLGSIAYLVYMLYSFITF